MSARSFGIDLFRKNAACHGDELLLLFKSCEIPMRGYYSETDREVGKTLLEYWTNFVKTGKPTTKLWTKFNSQSMLQIYSEGEVSLESLYGNTIVKSWLELYKENPPKLKQSQKFYQNEIFRL